MSEQWISSAQAIELVAQRYDASKRYADFDVARAVAEDALLKRLDNGALRARTAKGYMCSGDPFSLENESEFENECLPTSFWHNLRFCDDNERQADWVMGDFSYSAGSGDTSAIGNAFDVHFDAAGIPGALMAGDEVDDPENERRATGRPARFDWPKTVITVFGLLFRGDLKPQNQAEIERVLIAHLSGDDGGPSESTVRPYAKLIWQEYSKA